MVALNCSSKLILKFYVAHEYTIFIVAQDGKMLHVQLLVMLAARVCAKRKLKVRGKVKWFSLVDILLVQNTYDPIYWAAWILWCFWWDIFDRKWYKTAAGMGWTIAALRTVFVLLAALTVPHMILVDSIFRPVLEKRAMS